MKKTSKLLTLGLLFIGCETSKPVTENKQLDYTFSNEDYIEKEYFDELLDKIESDSLSMKTNGLNAQINDDAYYLLDKIIQLTKQPNDSIYELSSRNDIGKGFLKNYYEFRTKDRPFFKFFEIDSVTDEVGFDSIRLKNDMLRWKAKYRVLDSVFTKEDIERIMEKKLKDTKWDSTNIIFNSKRNSLIRWNNGDYYKNFISKPYYNQKRSHLFIIYSRIKRTSSTTMYIFKKDEEDWLLIDTIENVGW